MYNISISEKEKNLINYKLAFIRSRKFDIQNKDTQSFIRKTFHDAILLNESDEKSKMISLIQRSLFHVEKEDQASERILPKESDFFILTLFFESVIDHHKNGLNVSKQEKAIFSSLSPIEILLKCFCVLIEEKILQRFFFKKQNIHDPIKFINSTSSLLSNLKEVFTENKHKTWINKCIKALNEFSLPKIEQSPSKIIESNTIPSTSNSSKNELEVVKKEPKKPLSKLSASEINDMVNSVSSGSHNLSDDELINFVSFIVKNKNRIEKHLKDKNSFSFFYHFAIEKNIYFVIVANNRFFDDLKSELLTFLKIKKPKDVHDSLLLNFILSNENFDYQYLVEDFLKSYKENSFEHVDNIFLKNDEFIDDLSTSYSNSNFLFFDSKSKQDLMILNFFIIAAHHRGTFLHFDGEEFWFEHEKFNLNNLLLKEGIYQPFIGSSWSFYKFFLLNLYNYTVLSLNDISDDLLPYAKHFLSTLEFVNIQSTNFYGLLHYKIMNFNAKPSELSSFVSLLEKSNGGKKLFFNKKLADRILLHLVNNYSSLSNAFKSFFFSKIEDAIVLEWFNTLDPNLVEVAQLINLPISDSLNVILNNLSEIKHYAQFGMRSGISY